MGAGRRPRQGHSIAQVPQPPCTHPLAGILARSGHCGESAARGTAWQDCVGGLGGACEPAWVVQEGALHALQVGVVDARRRPWSARAVGWAGTLASCGCRQRARLWQAAQRWERGERARLQSCSMLATAGAAADSLVACLLVACVLASRCAIHVGIIRPAGNQGVHGTDKPTRCGLVRRPLWVAMEANSRPSGAVLAACCTLRPCRATPPLLPRAPPQVAAAPPPPPPCTTPPPRSASPPSPSSPSRYSRRSICAPRGQSTARSSQRGQRASLNTASSSPRVKAAHLWSSRARNTCAGQAGGRGAAAAKEWIGWQESAEAPAQPQARSAAAVAAGGRGQRAPGAGAAEPASWPPGCPH